MSEKPLVSIIVNCKNGEKYLNQALDSVLKQTYSNWELIFFDNFSSDNSKKILMDYKEFRFKYFLNDNETNLSVARNRAIKKAKGKIITILDHDDWWDRNKLKNQVECFKNNQIDLVFSDFYLYYQNFNKTKLIKSKIKGNLYSSIINNYNLGINTFAFNANIFKKYSFDENYHIIGDYSLIFELSKTVKWKRINKPTSYYRIHSSNETTKNELPHINELEHWYLNKFIVFEKNERYKKKIANKINYMKFKNNLINRNKKFLINFKETNFFSLFKLKEIYLMFIYLLKK